MTTTPPPQDGSYDQPLPDGWTPLRHPVRCLVGPAQPAWDRLVGQWTARTPGHPVLTPDELADAAKAVQETVNQLWLPHHLNWDLATGLVTGPWPEGWTAEQHQWLDHANREHLGLNVPQPDPDPYVTVLRLLVAALEIAGNDELDDRQDHTGWHTLAG